MKNADSANGRAVSRRTMLATLPVAPVLTFPSVTRADRLRNPDPALVAYATWREAETIEDNARDALEAKFDEVGYAQYSAELDVLEATLMETRWAAGVALSKIVPTTPQGIAAQLRFAKEGAFWEIDEQTCRDSVNLHLYQSISAGLARLGTIG